MSNVGKMISYPYTWSVMSFDQPILRGTMIGVIKEHLHFAKIPFLPLREKLAQKPVLYGVLSLLNLTYLNGSIMIDLRRETGVNTHHGIFDG